MSFADWQSYAANTFKPVIRAHYFFTVWRNYKLLLAGLEIPRGELLEIGSSTGQISLRLAMKYNLKPTLVDSSGLALSLAYQLYSRSSIRPQLIHQNALSLELNRSFNFVHSHGLLEHFKAKEQKIVFYNHVKHVKEGGWLICWVPTPDIFYRINRKYLEKTSQWIFGYEKPLTLDKFLALFNHFKLKICKVRHLPGWLGVAAQKIS
ncbi:MAG: class I SAM-dependent methyltransferase [Candidatus Hodarchaeales archaeon]